jgi:hypothetical protein
MSPEMLTLVAAVLAYDRALDNCDLPSSIVLADDAILSWRGRRASAASLKERSCTRLENDMT